MSQEDLNEDKDSTNLDDDTEDIENNLEEDLDEDSSESEDTSDSQVELAKSKKTIAKLYKRMKTAEGFISVDGKWVKDPKAVNKNISSKVEDNNEINSQSLTRDESIFFAKFGSQENAEELFDQLLVISKGKGISVKEAQEDPLYKAFKEQSDADLKTKKASLPPSGGSKGSPPKPISEMTEKEHKKYFEELNK